MRDLARFRSRLLVAFLALAAISICGCGAIAPGYQIQKESLTVHFISGNPPHLAIRADYRLANIGNSPLHFIPLALPGEKDFGLANFGAQIDGKNVAPQRNPDDAAEDWRIPLASSWRQKQKINLTLSYDLAASAPVDPRIFVATNMFYLNDSGWFPQLLGFKVLFAPSPTRPNPTLLDVIVPADFRATASGQPRGTKKQRSETEYNFRIGKAGFDPYVLAGQYDEQRVSTSAGTLVLWTSKPLAAAQSQLISSQTARAASFFSQTFGPLPKSIHAIYAVEPLGGIPSSIENWPSTVPPATIIIRSADSSEHPAANSDAAQLAATWFSHVIRPSSNAWTLASGLSTYAAAQSHDAGGASRRNRIASSLADYTRASAQAVEKPVLSLTQTDSAIQQQLAAAKLQLFFAALEDKCGQQNLTHAISDMVYALHGENYGYNDFRAALEDRCHQDLADFFRTWLALPGIPPDFRARYGNAGVK